jgi:hypothetical protein
LISERFILVSQSSLFFAGYKQGYRDTEIQGYRDTGIQGYRDTGIQGYRDTTDSERQA